VVTMTNNEMENILTIVISNYRNMFKDHNSENFVFLKNTWQYLLGHLEYQQVYNGVMQHIADGNEFPPNAGQILNKLVKRTVSKDEAYTSFDHIIYLIGRYGSWNYPKALEEMSNIEKKIMTKSYYDQLCMSENLDVARSQYRDYYLSLAERHEKETKELTGSPVKKLTLEEL